MDEHVQDYRRAIAPKHRRVGQALSGGGAFVTGPSYGNGGAGGDGAVRIRYYTRRAA